MDTLPLGLRIRVPIQILGDSTNFESAAESNDEQ